MPYFRSRPKQTEFKSCLPIHAAAVRNAPPRLRWKTGRSQTIKFTSLRGRVLDTRLVRIAEPCSCPRPITSERLACLFCCGPKRETSEHLGHTLTLSVSCPVSITDHRFPIYDGLRLSLRSRNLSAASIADRTSHQFNRLSLGMIVANVASVAP